MPYEPLSQIDLTSGLIISASGAALAALTLLTAGLVATALYAIILPRILDAIIDLSLPRRSREHIARARRQGVKRNRAATGRSGIWRRQVAAEESSYLATLRVQLHRENR